MEASKEGKGRWSISLVRVIIFPSSLLPSLSPSSSLPLYFFYLLPTLLVWWELKEQQQLFFLCKHRELSKAAVLKRTYESPGSVNEM